VGGRQGAQANDLLGKICMTRETAIWVSASVTMAECVLRVPEDG